jgi:Family of unknown function (DUF6049)
MVRRRSLRAALVATAAVLGSTVLGFTPAHADESDLRGPDAKVGATSVQRTPSPSRKALRSAAKATPLAVTIDTLTPSSIPARGKVRVAGTITNTDSVPWLTVNVYSFISAEPMTTRTQLAAAVEVDESTAVGERITDLGSYDTIDAIEPGESKQFRFTVDADQLGADTPGVYWFGVHALGQRSDEGRDELAIADGRARTFLPMVPERRDGQESVAVVVPLRGPLEYAADGSLDDLERWTTTLADGGRLRSLVELAATSGDRTVSWVVDPALIDAVRQLASGNPARSLAANLEEGEDDGEGDGTEPASPTGPGSGSGSEEPSPSATPSTIPGNEPGDEPGDDPATAELSDDLDPETRAAAEVAREWLGRLQGAMDANDEVLALPYGDLDVSAAARHDRQAYPRSRARSAGTLPVVGLETAPAIAAPGGYVSPDALRSIDQDTTILVTDKMFDRAPAVAAVSGRRLVVTSTGAAEGGPAPGDPLGTIALRQRILAEAAVRFLRPARSPLVVLLPPDWVPPASSSFFSGLDLEWVDLTSVEQATDDADVESMSAADLSYPDWQRAYELDAANFAAAKELRETGEVLQSMLTLNNLVGDTVTDQALASTSYSARVRPDFARVTTDQSRLWIEERMDQVEVSAPPAVTLSSVNGSFPISISNELDEPVTVSVAAQVSDRALRIADPGEVDILAKGSATVLLEARTDTPGIHDVTIVVTDKTGRPLGGSAELSIRSARVSNVIWLFLATGIGLLFGTIAFRLVRRVRAART